MSGDGDKKTEEKAEKSPGTPKSRELDARLETLRGKLDDRARTQDEEEAKGLNDRSGMAYGLKIASEFVSAVLVGGGLGWVADHWLGTAPFGLILLLLLGFAAGVVNVMRATGQMAEPGARRDK